MAYVITTLCRDTKDASCVEVCPVDCIHPTPDEPGFAESDQLYIDADECIDCDACTSTCPVEAIYADQLVPEEHHGSVLLNAEYYASRQS